LLVESLEGLLAQSYPSLEIVVYDQTPQHPPEVEDYLKRISHRARIVHGAPAGLVAAYRQCVALAQGEICLFVDDDVLVTDPELVAKHARHYPDPELGLLVGQILHEGQTEPRAPHPRLETPGGWRYAHFDIDRRIENMPTAAAAHMSFPREVYEQVGGFDSAYAGSGFRFETDFSFAVRRLGKRIRFDPEISLVHRYGSPGGAENRQLVSTDAPFDRWLNDYFANTWYFLLKWHGLPTAAFLMTRFWREQALNRALLRQGPGAVWTRHQALGRGLARGFRAWRAWVQRERRP
jgi:GT2 family glycosyltransferase